MVIISRNNPRKRTRFLSSQMWFASIYVVITLIALLLLNIYSSKLSQQMFYTEKHASMAEKCKFAASIISELEVLNTNTIKNAISNVDELSITRMIITDTTGKAIYDSSAIYSTENQYVLFPEVVKALQGNDVFHWNFQNGVMRSVASSPIDTYGAHLGCVYIMDYDIAQSNFFLRQQKNIFIITLILEIIVILFSIVFARIYAHRFNRIISSVRTLRKGDYTQKVNLNGYDELKDLGNEFNELSQRLKVSEEKQNRFVSDASHELKTPLASIKLLSDSILQNDMDTETIREFVADIGHEADRLNKMSQKLLALSGSNAQADTVHEIVYIEPTVDRTIRMLKSVADANGVHIIKDIKTDCPVLFGEGDLYEIIYNLTENGIKYNKKGGMLTITVEKQDSNCIICFKDTGVGIASDASKHIFERFYRVDKARSRSTGGSGLGLAIVRSITKRNNGEIRVESTPGIGSEFILEFPIFDIEEAGE